MNRTSLIVLLATSMAASVGCASKNYVRQETTPLINKTNELDDLTAKNTNAIKDVDARAQAGIQEVTAKAAEVDQKAQAAAGQQAGQAQTQADNAVHRVDSLQNTVANLDNYRVVTETAVHFGFDKDNLTKTAQGRSGPARHRRGQRQGLHHHGRRRYRLCRRCRIQLRPERAPRRFCHSVPGFEAQHPGAQDLSDRAGQGQAGRFEQDPGRPRQEPSRGCPPHDQLTDGTLRRTPDGCVRAAVACKDFFLLPGGLRQLRPLHPPERPVFSFQRPQPQRPRRSTK